MSENVVLNDFSDHWERRGTVIEFDAIHRCEIVPMADGLIGVLFECAEGRQHAEDIKAGKRPSIKRQIVFDIATMRGLSAAFAQAATKSEQATGKKLS